jgi:DNA-binding NtrC family response regulator
LQSAVRRALLQTTGPVLVAESLPEEIRTGIAPGASSAGAPPAQGVLELLVDERLRNGTTDLYAEALVAMEKCVVTRVLKLTGGNQSQAAKILGITRGSLRNKIHALNIQIGSVVLLDEPSVETAEAHAS